MRNRVAKRLLTTALTLAVTAGTVTAVAPAAAAALPPHWQVYSSTITGDLTGDGVRDRFELAGRGDRFDTAVCGVQLRAGLGDGRFADPVLYRLPVGSESGGECPELGVVLTAPTAAQNRLAVTYEYAGNIGQVFDFADGRFTLQSRFAAGIEPYVLASRDFDGDGYGDLYTIWGNDFGGLEAFVSRGRTWTTLYSRGETRLSSQFLDLDRDGGTDILVTWSSDCAPGTCVPAGVEAVNGRTGQILQLERTVPGQTRGFSSSFVDADHDRFLDILVETYNGNGRDISHQTFINHSQRGGWSFVPRSP